MDARPRRAVDDDELLAMLEQSEARASAFAALDQDVDEDVPPGDACPHCGEAQIGLGDCVVCGHAGCLPRDDWTPGWNEPCLSTCSRCAMPFHVDCGGVSHVGNPVCGTCGPALDPEDL